MSKYTSNDIEVQMLTPGERSDYEFSLMKHDVEANQEIYQTSQTAKSVLDAKKFGDLFKDPKYFREAILRLLLSLLFIVIILFLIVWIIIILTSKPGEDNPRLKLMKNYFIYFIVLLILLLIFYYLYNMLFKETIETALLAKE